MAPQAMAAVYAQRGPSEFSRFVTLTDTLTLEESTDVVTVSPAVSIDRDGGFLVADGREGQVRLYSARGALKHHFGANGPGPMEFRSLAKAIRLPSGEIAAADMGGKLAVFDSGGARLVRQIPTGVVPLYDLVVLDPDHLVIAGRVHGEMESLLLHIFNLRTGQIERSLMRVPRHDPEFDGAYAFTGFSAVAVRGDTIAGIFALSDSVFLYSQAGQELGTVPIPYQHFTALTKPLPSRASRTQTQEWMESFSAASNLFWMNDGTFVVQYSDTEKGDMHWRLLRMSRQGRPIFEIMDTPMLLAASPNNGELFFVRPHAETLNLWSVGSFRP